MGTRKGMNVARFENVFLLSILCSTASVSVNLSALQPYCTVLSFTLRLAFRLLGSISRHATPRHVA